jgi:tRNA(Ile)-lysidine synthase
VNYLVAVSGGIDSVVLLDMLVREHQHELTVAHFDHGIRPDSAADARFVEALAAMYQLPFVSKREELGSGASEELARSRRYAFLRAEAEKRNAMIITAHHGDDVVETIAINLIRGTGWRGVAVLDSPTILRPLLSLTKKEIRTYARSRRLEWVEDSTNAGDDYLRNRVRRRVALALSAEQRQAVIALWKRQVELKRSIDHELRRFVRVTGEYDRYFFIFVDTSVACEVLRAAVVAKANTSSTRPQLERALLAIKVAKPGTTFEIGGGVSLRFTIRTFIVYTP